MNRILHGDYTCKNSYLASKLKPSTAMMKYIVGDHRVGSFGFYSESAVLQVAVSRCMYSVSSMTQ